MDILISLIWLLVYLAILFGVYYLLEWGISTIFPAFPPKVLTIIMVIFVLIGIALILMWLVNVIPGGGPSLFPKRP